MRKVLETMMLLTVMIATAFSALEVVAADDPVVRVAFLIPFVLGMDMFVRLVKNDRR